MAFVFEEERKFDFNNGIEKNEVGPGQYLPQTEIKIIKQGTSCFESTTAKCLSTNSITPGPGAYYHDTTKDNNIKVKENEKLVEVSKVNTIEKSNNKLISTDDPVTKQYIQAKNKVKTNFERLGFSVKEKRFLDKRGNNIPGPGEYSKGISEQQYRITSAKCLQMKGKIRKLKPGQLKDKFGHISSIPQKETYGYEIDKDNNLIKKTNPDSFKTFSGVNGDTVGPGTYDIDLPEQWRRTGTNWSKSKISRDPSAKPRPKTGKSALFESKAFHPQEDNSNNKLGCSYFNIEMFKQYSVKQIANKKGFIADAMKITNVRNNRDDIPGPGYYYDVNLHSGFYKASKAPKKDSSSKDTYFGSSNERFGKIDFTSSINNTNLGPGQYFSEAHSNHFKQKHFTNKQRNSNKVPFSSKCERFSYTANANTQANSSSTSLASTSSSFFNKNTSMSGTFYRKQKRFIEAEKEMERLKEGPGPGSYINPFSNTGTSNTVLFNGRYVDLRKGKEFLMDNTRPPTSKEDVLENKRRSFGPPVGKYNPETIMTIKYNNMKRLGYGNGEDVAFNSSRPQGRGVVQIEKEIVGPGSYEQIKPKRFVENEIPFNSSTQRGLSNQTKKNDTQIHKEMLGPGKYDYDECYSWIKKSFNVKYI